MKRIFGLLMVCLALGAGATETAGIRLAVLATNSRSESHALAELLAVELSNTDGIELVERSEIDRILAEHELTESDLVKTDARVLLGRLMGAQGLAFVSFDDGNARWVIRLAETRRGFLAGLTTIAHTADGDGLDGIVQAACGRLLSFVPKLTADTKHQTLITILRFNDARMVPYRVPADHVPIAPIFPILLAEKLSQEPGILLLERRQLGLLRDEANLTDEEPAFTISGILIEGELGLPLGVVSEGDGKLVFTVRFLDPARREIKRYEQPGSSTELDALLEATAAGILSTLSELIETPASDRLADEVRTLVNLARKHGSFWAADAAYALDPADQNARDILIKLLIDRAFQPLPDNSNALQEVHKLAAALARAERICRDANVSFKKKLLIRRFMVREYRYFRDNMQNTHTRNDSEIRRILRPVREAVRNELESEANTTTKVHEILQWGYFAYDGKQPAEYILPLIDLIMADDSMSDDRRDGALLSIIKSRSWPTEIYREWTDHADPIFRFYANIMLMRMYFLPEQRRPYALAALQDLETVFMRDNGLGDYFNQALDTMIGLFPDEVARIHQLAFSRMQHGVSRLNFRLIMGLDYHKHLLNIDPCDSLEWIDAVEMIGQTNTMRLTSFEMGLVLPELATVKEAIMAKLTIRNDRDGAATAISRSVMLEPENINSRWRVSLPAGLREAWTSARITPQRLLLEGDNLWIGVGGRLTREREQQPATHGYGLIQMDLTTGRVLSLQSGIVTGSLWDSAPTVFQPHMTNIQRFRSTTQLQVPMLPMFPWHDKIVVPQGNAGILLYPANPESGSSDLRSVEIIDERSGLLSTTFYQVLASDDSLFILSNIDPNRSRQLLMRWDRSLQQTFLLLDTEQEGSVVATAEKGLPRIRHLDIDRTNRKLLVVLRRSGRNQAPYWAYDMDTGDWSKLSELGGGASASALTAEQPAVWPDSEPMFYGFSDWNDGTLGITGVERDWKIEFFTRDPASNVTTGEKTRINEQPDVLDQVVTAFDPQPVQAVSLNEFLDSLIQKLRDGQRVTDNERQQTVEKFNRYCSDIIRKHGVRQSGIRLALQYIPPPDHTDVYLNSVRMAMVHYPQYGIWLNPRRTSAAIDALPNMIHRLQGEFDPLLLFATIFPALDSGRTAHAVRAVETLWEVDPFLARKAMLLSTEVRPHDAWMSNYYSARGQDEDAERAAAMLGDTQTRVGLETQAAFLEKRGNLAEAERLLLMVDNQFNMHGALVSFYTRRGEDTNADGVPYVRKLNALRDRFFPDGMRRVTLGDFREPPRTGAQFSFANTFSRVANRYGIKSGDVIVAVDGFRVNSFGQYLYVRDLDAANPRMNLILWNGNEYVEIVTELEKRLFGLRIEDYKP